MQFKGLKKIRVAVLEIDEAAKKFAGLFGMEMLSPPAPANDPTMRFANFGQGGGSSAVELVSPAGTDSALGRFLARRGEGVYNVQVAVDDIDEFLRVCGERGIALLGKPGPPPRRACWVKPVHTGSVLFEVIEERN